MASGTPCDLPRDLLGWLGFEPQVTLQRSCLAELGSQVLKPLIRLREIVGEEMQLALSQLSLPSDVLVTVLA